jgi:hypothetical protein
MDMKKRATRSQLNKEEFLRARAFSEQTYLAVITPLGIICATFFIRKKKMKTI